MTIQDRLSEIEERAENEDCFKSWAHDDLPKLVKALRVTVDALCEADVAASDRRLHDVTAISDKALTEIERILNAEGEG